MGVAPAGRGVLRGRDVNGLLLRPVGLPGGLRWFAGDVFSEHEAEGHSGERLDAQHERGVPCPVGVLLNALRSRLATGRRVPRPAYAVCCVWER